MYSVQPLPPPDICCACLHLTPGWYVQERLKGIFAEPAPRILSGVVDPVLCSCSLLLTVFFWQTTCFHFAPYSLWQTLAKHSGTLHRHTADVTTRTNRRPWALAVTNLTGPQTEGLFQVLPLFSKLFKWALYHMDTSDKSKNSCYSYIK